MAKPHGRQRLVHDLATTQTSERQAPPRYGISDTVIERYRTATVSKDYLGDTILNSVMDVACMALGFWLARKLPVWASVALILAFEAVTVWLIRDGLALNVLMLLWPVDAVRAWQAVAAG